MAPNTLSLTSLNHISKVCRDVERSVAFYRDVLGFFLVKRPDSFDFDGAWLYNYGIGVHLISGDPPHRSRQINPQADHISFQADDLDSVVCRLEELRIPYVQQTVQEAGKSVQQIFVHDPDDNMIEICNCGCLPVIYINVTDVPPQVADTSLKISSHPHPHPHPPVAGAWSSATTTP